MPSTVEQLSPSRVKLTVEIPFSDLKSHLDKAYRDIAAQVNIPGFRKGKVPAAVIDQRFGRGMVLQEAINAALPQAYGQAIDEAKIVPLGEPEVEVTKLEDGDVVEFVAEVEVRPEITLPAFDTLSATVDTVPATDEGVEERIELMRKRFASTTEVSRKAKKGDVLTLDLEGSRDGEPLPDANASGVSYELGSGGMLDGLDKAITGLKAGATAEFASTLVGGPLEGEPADIKVTVTKVSEQTLPAVDDEFAQLISEFDTVEEMRADLAKAVESMGQSEQQTQARDKVLEALLEAVAFELPERTLAAEIAARHSDIEQQLANAGLTLERYLDSAEEEEASTPEEFWATMDARTTSSLKAQIVLDAIADEREVSVEQAELTQLIVRKAMQNGTSPEQEAQHMMEHNHLPAWMQEVRRSKALQLIMDEAVVTDSNGAAVDTKAPAPAAEDE